MATVHTAYGPGEIVDQQTVRGRTSYKVAGDGFEVWLDAAKVAGYDSPGGIDPDAPHWQGHDLGDTLTGDAFGGGYAPADGDDFADIGEVSRYHRDRLRAHPDDVDDFDEDYLRRNSARRQGWAAFDEDNSTELPYNPRPQHDAIGTPGDDDSSTIQPVHHIDADERLSPADSVDFEDTGEDTGPGPSRELFAARQNTAYLPVINPISLIKSKPVRKVVERTFGPGQVDNVDAFLESGAVGHGLNQAQGVIDRVVDTVSPGPGWGDLIKGGSRREANPAALALPLLRAVGPALASGLMDGGGNGDGGGPVDDFAPGEGWGDLVKDAARPAGLSDRYIDITAGADYHNDPVAQFRHDPDAYINRIGHLMDEGLNPRFAEYMDLVEADTSIRTAAWKDVRAKAMRLKTSGAVHVKDIAPNRIMASVDGDHGTYDVLILKDGSFGGLGGGTGSHAISNWHCGCEWGRWAFRRKFTYVGRLCSHAYASYLTMQSAHMTNQPRAPKRPPRKAPSRALPFLHVKRADNLQNGPQRLTPELVVNDADDAHLFVDVERDERDDTGPDDVVSDKDIVHFARLMRHCEVTQQPYPRQLVAFLARYAGCADDASDDTQTDYEAHDADDADEYLDKIRSDADRKQEDDFGDMAERVHRIQDAVEEARDNGADASRFVAMVRKMADPISDWLDREFDPATGRDKVKSTGKPAPSTSEMIRDRAGLDKVYDPNLGRDVPKNPSAQSGPLPNASETTGNGGPANSSRERKGLPPVGGSPNDPQAGKDLSYIPGTQGKGTQGQGQQTQQSGGGGQAQTQTVTKTDNGGGSGGGAQTYTAPGGGQTSGNVADGGVAGAENGNNTAITKDMLDADGNYTVQAGDTLTDIAQRATGDMNKYQDIAKANSGITNVDDIGVGTKINLKDFANDTGNNGVSGDKTNPAGGGADKDIATPEIPKADTSAIGGAADATNTMSPTPNPASGTPGDTSSGTDTGSGIGSAAGATMTNQDGSTQSITDPSLSNPAPPKIGSASWWLQRFAAPAATNPATDPNQTTTPTTTGDAATSTTAKPGASPATTPATPGGTAPSATPTPATPAPGGSASPAKTVGPNKDTDTYDPSDPAQQAQQQQTQQPGTGQGRNDGTQTNDMTGGPMSGMDALGTGLGAASDIASGLAGAIPDLASGAAAAMPAVGDAISGIASGIGSIFASKSDFDDFVRYAYPTADAEGDLQPHTHPFAGSGYPGPLEIGTSEEYADKARKDMDDVTDLGSGDLVTPMKEWQKQGSAEDDDPYREASIGYSTDDDSDIVRTFQAHLGETALGAGVGGGAGRFDDIAGAAQGFLRTAGRNYSLAEQDALIREGDKGGARNLDSLDLKGTHYEDMTTLGW